LFQTKFSKHKNYLLFIKKDLLKAKYEFRTFLQISHQGLISPTFYAQLWRQ
jgi:hypothetical protein